mgnify:CR=1 FL=1
MKISFALLTALLLGSSSAGALAAATPEGAQRLTAALQAYLSAEAGVVTVTPSGETYALKIDAAPLLAKVQAPGFSASLTSFLLYMIPYGMAVNGIHTLSAGSCPATKFADSLDTYGSNSAFLEATASGPKLQARSPSGRAC